MIYVYADQNFVSSCSENPAWRDAVVRARDSERVSLVLSPQHFLEIGKAPKEVRDRILALVDDARPSWTYTHADSQLRECTTLWDRFSGRNVSPFVPIVTLHEAAGAMHNVPAHRLAKGKLHDWVKAFSPESEVADPLAEIRKTLEQQKAASARNQEEYRKGRITPQMMRSINLQHVCLQLARRSLGDIELKKLFAATITIARDPGMRPQLERFLDTHLSELTSYQVESAMTTEVWDGTAIMSPGRVVDRQHASVGMPYCQIFVTDDKDLVKRCEFAKRTVPFATATVKDGETFIQSL